MVSRVVCGNHVCVWRGVTGKQAAPKVIVLVHNRQPDVRALSRATESLLAAVEGAAAQRLHPLARGRRWLIMAATGKRIPGLVYRQIYKELGIEGRFERVFVVFADREVVEVSR